FLVRVTLSHYILPLHDALPIFCDQPENVVRSASRLLGCDWEDLDPVYFGLNHYGWFTHVYNVHTGEDLLPKIRELVKERGFLHQDRKSTRLNSSHVSISYAVFC